ncbi:hypothetical protein OIV83_000444 [Microbotryomycetes sp. JL201]|nr:hypothetical protein OIV83_000444 [Microbotryomycetes sp. JL201]
MTSVASPLSPTLGGSTTNEPRPEGTTDEHTRPDELWSSILDSVSGSKGVLTKNCIVLGKSKSGKSTLVSRLSSKTGEPSNTSAQGTADLGLSYNVIDVHDEGDEETVARLGVYQLPSPEPPHASLLSLALTPATFMDSIILIVLDWEQPWRFMRDLHAWTSLLDELVDERGIGSSQAGSSARERLETLFKQYVEPSAVATTATSAAHLIHQESPLPSGTLTSNIGLDIVIVCSKADQISTLERERTLKEDQYDFIQQSLRTVALKYGAAVFFTTRTRPESFIKLRSYVLHRLFASGRTGAPSATTSKLFAFPHRANVVDKDQVVMPSGWDSWGKIKVLKERFDPESFGRAWDEDIDSVRARRRRRVDSANENASEDTFEGRGGKETEDETLVAVKLYEDTIVDYDSQRQPINSNSSEIKAEDEQTFLRRHYEYLQKEREKDPRAAFGQRGSSSASTMQNSGGNESSFAGRSSVVGPMSSYGLSSVERTLSERATSSAMSAAASSSSSVGGASTTEDASTRFAKMIRKDSGQSQARSPNLGSSAGGGTTASTGTGSGGQNEVLANFFQSLLAARGSSGTSPKPLPTSGFNSAANASPALHSSTKSASAAPKPEIPDST